MCSKLFCPKLITLSNLLSFYKDQFFLILAPFGMEKSDPSKDFEDDYNFHRRNIRIHSIATPENRHGEH